MNGNGNVAPAPFNEAGPGVAVGVAVGDVLDVGVSVGVAVELGEGLGDVAGFDRAVWATIAPMIMTIATIAAIIVYVVFIFCSSFLITTY